MLVLYFLFISMVRENTCVFSLKELELSHGSIVVVSHEYLSESRRRKSLSVCKCDGISVHRVDTNLVVLQLKGNATGYVAVFPEHASKDS